MRTHLLQVASAVVVGLLLGPTPASAQTDSIRLLASNGFRAVIEALSPTCTRATGRPIGAQFGTSTALTQRVNSGEIFDVAIMTTEALDELVKAGKLIGSTRVPLGRSGIGIGVQRGATKPDIRSPAALKNTLLAARSITYAGDGASRPHIEAMVQAMGIADEMTKKTILEQGSVRAALKVESGEAELLITLISEILPAPGVDLVGPLPSEFQRYVTFAAATNARTSNQAAAKGVIACLSGSAVSGTLRAKGMERP
jgi:molybdate transport system substrate-binding protein